MAAREAGGVVLGKAADKLFSLSGLFAVYKPKGPTSAGVLNILKEKLLAEAGVQTNGNKRNQVLKIGHGGTLDSAAAGVLANVDEEGPWRQSFVAALSYLANDRNRLN